MTARVAGLTRYHQKAEPGETLAEASLLTGLGLEGDMYCGGERQISLLSAEARRWMEAQTEKGLCFGRFRENILIEGMSLDELPDNSLLCVGDAVLRISARGKSCHSECELFSAAAECRLSRCAVFAAVVRGGVVRIGDRVFLSDQ